MSRNTLIVLPFFPMSQFSHDAPVVKPAERKFVPPLPREMPVAEKASHISPELQAEQEAIQEQMAEARVALQTANEEIGVLRETIRQLEGKRGLTEEEQADLAESKRQLASYDQDLAESANRLSRLFERNREIQAFIESASSGTSGEAIVEQVKQTKEAEARAKETPSERVGREYQEVTTQYDEAKRTIAEKEAERQRLAEELKEAEYAAGRVDFEARPITEEVHNKHEAAVARVERITQQIKAADAVIAQQKDALVDAERKSIALFSGPAIEGANGKQSVREVVAAEAGKNAKERVAEHFQNPEEGIAWMRNEYLPARMKETILPSRKALEVEYKQREEAAKRAGTSFSRQDFLNEIRERADADQTVKGLMDSARKATADRATIEFLQKQRAYFDRILSGFAQKSDENQAAFEEAERDQVLNMGKAVLIKDMHTKGNWLNWLNEGAGRTEAKKAEAAVHARADAGEAIARQEELFEKQQIARPAFEEHAATLKQEQNRAEQINELQREIRAFEKAQADVFEPAILAEIAPISERVRTLRTEAATLSRPRNVEQALSEARSAIIAPEAIKRKAAQDLEREETKHATYLDQAVVWGQSDDAEMPTAFTLRQLMNGEHMQALNTYLEKQKQMLATAEANKPRKLFNEANFNAWAEAKEKITQRIAQVEGQSGLLSRLVAESVQARLNEQAYAKKQQELKAALEAAQSRFAAASAELAQRQKEIERSARRGEELEKELQEAIAKETRLKEEVRAHVRANQAQEKRAFLQSKDQALLAQANSPESNRSSRSTEVLVAEALADDVKGVMEAVTKKQPAEKLPVGTGAQALYLESEILKRAQKEADASRKQADAFVTSVRETIRNGYNGEYNDPGRRWQERQGNPADLASDLTYLLGRKTGEKGSRMRDNILNAWPQNG